jgi:hypothetical protein
MPILIRRIYEKGHSTGPLNAEINQRHQEGCHGESVTPCSGLGNEFKEAENVMGAPIFPDWVSLGSGRYAIDLGVNVYGLLLCTAGYIVGATILGQKREKIG